VSLKTVDLTAPGRVETIRDDFDRIADAGSNAVADSSPPYLGELLGVLPARIGSAVDLGCGTGDLVRTIADRADRVIGIDLSPRMIALARERSHDRAGVEYQIGDFMTADLPARAFDAVCSVATLHHLPLAPALVRAASLVRTGGWLLVIDLFRPTGPGGFVHNASSWLLARWLAHQRPRPSRAVRDAWRAHDAHDRYPTLAEIRAATAALPGARVAVRPLWRWTLAWCRPAVA
jgi:SAM-dependent methyltransferase